MARKYAIGQAIPDPISGGLDALRQGLIAMQEQKSRGVDNALKQRQLDLLKIKQEQEAKDFEAKNAPVDYEPLRPYYSPEEQAGYDKTYGTLGPDGKIAPYKIPRVVAEADLERRKLLASMKEADARLAGNKKDTVSLKRVYAIRGVPYPEGQEDVEVKLSDVDQFIPKPANEKEKESQLTEVPAEEYFQSIGRKMPPRFAGKTIKVKLPEYGQAPKAESIDRRVRLGDLARVRGVDIPADLGETLVDPSVANELFGAVKEPKEDNSMTVNQARALRGLPPVRGEEGSLRIKASDIDNLFGRIEAPKKEDALISVDEALEIRGQPAIGGKLGQRMVKPSDLDNVLGPVRDPKDPKQQNFVSAESFYGGVDKLPPGMKADDQIPIGAQTLKFPGSEKVDNNAVRDDYRKYAEEVQSGKRRPIDFPIMDNETSAERAIRTALIQNQQTGVSNAFRSRADSRDAGRLKKSLTVPYEQGVKLQDSISRLERINQIAKVAPQIKTGLRAGGKAWFENIASSFGRKMSTDTELLNELQAITSQDNIKAVYENSGKQASASEMARYKPFQVNPSTDSPERIAQKISGLNSLLKEQIGNHIKGLSQTYEYGLEDAQDRLNKAVSESSAKPSILDRMAPKAELAVPRPMKKSDGELLGEARAAVRRGAPKDAVKNQLKGWGVKGWDKF